MMRYNLIEQMSFDYAVKVVNAYKFLSGEKKEFVLSKQMLRSGTSIGANVEEAIGAQSKADFLAKLSIAYKEARETHYWIRILNKTGYLPNDQSEILLTDIDSLKRIIAKIRLTTLSNMRGNGQ